jgi:hypothetical protein
MRSSCGEFEKIPGICTEIPEDLERAEVIPHRSLFSMRSSSPWLKAPTPAIPTNLESAQATTPKPDIWAVDVLKHSDEGRDVAESIRQGTAYAVSDGSFKEQRGTSAFLLEGPTGEATRIIGMNEIPGSLEDQSAYRSELGGISGVLATVDCLCRLYHIKGGKIKCGLDGEQAMLHASGTNPLDPQQPSFDLLVDIRNKVKSSPIQWEFFWIEGHQLERHGKSDSWGKLNEVCDAIAKLYWNQVVLTREPRENHRFGHEQWSVTIQGKKLAKLPLTALYELTFGETISKQYWIQRHHIAPHLFTNVNWDICGKSLKSLPFGKKRWLLKHLTGFCAVGRVMKRRKEWDHDLCPLCLLPNETAPHVLFCTDHRARNQWIQSITKLEIALAKARTDPAIIKCIGQRLLALRFNNARRYSPNRGTTEVRRALAEQDLIGWVPFLRGCISRKWEDAQDKWMVARATKWKRSSARWMQKLTVATWEVSWEMWDHRNSILHDPLHPWRQQELSDLNEQISRETLAYEESGFLPKDRRLFNHSAEHKIKNYSVKQKRQWIRSIDMSRIRRNRSSAPSSGSRILMRNWLLQIPPPTAAPIPVGPSITQP